MNTNPKPSTTLSIYTYDYMQGLINQHHKTFNSLPCFLGLNKRYLLKSTILCYSVDTTLLVNKFNFLTAAIANKMNLFINKAVTTELKKYSWFHIGKHNRMPHNMIILASQDKSINQYKNTERKVLICNANIYFKQQCIKKDLNPKHVKMMLL
jgi:hypothetical protein